MLNRQELKQMIKARISQEAKQFKKKFSSELLRLATSGFGLVAALAWNELIREIVNVYIRPYFGRFSGLISLFTYALGITFLAVLVTYNLSKFTEKEEKKK